MKNIYLLVISLLFIGSTQAQTYDWVTTVLNGNNNRLAVGPSGTTYVYGFISDSVEFGAQTFYMADGTNYLASYNSSGDLISAVQLDSVTVRAMKATATSLYIAGNFASGGNIGSMELTGSDQRDAFYAQLDQSLNVTLVRTGMNDGTLDYFPSIDVDNSGNVYIGAGFIGDSLAVDGNYFTGTAGNDKALLLKFSPIGTLLLSKVWAMTGNGGIRFTNIAVDEVSGDIFMSADASDDAVKDSVSIDGIWYQTDGFDNDLIARFSSAGTGEAVRNVTTIFQEGITNLEVDGSGSPYITINHYVNGYTLEKLDQALDTLWTTSSSGSSFMGATDIEIRNDLIFISGSFNGIGSFHSAESDTSSSEKGFLVSLDTAGNFTGVRFIESSDHNEIAGAGTDLTGNVYLAGHLLGDATFENINVSINGSSEAGFVARIPAGIFVTNRLVHPEDNIVVVYPNPSDHHLNLEGLDEYSTMKVFDHSGRLVDRKDQIASKEILFTQTLSKGIYLVRLEGETKVTTVRFVKN